MNVILTLRTDKPEAEVGLYDGHGNQLSYHTWYAHRELSQTLLGVIHDQLGTQQTDLSGVHGIVVFRGPGSFTGLRIGVAVANTMAHELKVPIVGVVDEHEWLERGLARLAKGENDRLVVPEYGAEAHITVQKK